MKTIKTETYVRVHRGEDNCLDCDYTIEGITEWVDQLPLRRTYCFQMSEEQLAALRKKVLQTLSAFFAVMSSKISDLMLSVDVETLELDEELTRAVVIFDSDALFELQNQIGEIKGDYYGG